MIARPLAALTSASARLGRGQAHQPLAERGPRELRGVAAAFNRMASDLESIERERAMVLAGISHDLRTPLSRLRLAMEMNPVSDREAMVSDIDEIDAVIGQFLDYARGSNEDKAEGELNELLDELAGHYRRIHRDVSFHPGRVPPFRFARMAVRRAVANLVDNALRYASDPVEIQTSNKGAHVVVEVRDRGPGIPADAVERVKRPFTRLEDARSGAGGAGLGLAIVERVARSHQGSLDLLPREGGGLVARLTLLR
jgi:two-component system osmolarity sensor histidine kinase EnvZ